MIEDNVFVGMTTKIGPGTTIKKGAWIGYGNAFVNQVIEEMQKLAMLGLFLNRMKCFILSLD